MQFIPNELLQYKIVSALGHDMVLDCNEQRKICLYQWHKTANQRWKIKKSQNKKFHLQNVQHSTFLNIPNSSNLNIIQAQCIFSKKKQSEYFDFISCNSAQYKGKNAYYIRTHCGKVIDVCGGIAKNDQKLIQWDFHGQSNQIFFIEPVNFEIQQEAVYKIIPAICLQKCLDVSQNSSQYNHLIIYKYSCSANQHYKLKLHSKKLLIISQKDNLSLQLPQGSDLKGQRIRARQSFLKDYQLWEFIPCSHPNYKQNNAFYIRSHCGLFLDVKNASKNDQTPVIQWYYNGNANQIWFVQKFS